MSSNAWAREFPNPVLTIRCFQRSPAKPRVVAVVVAHPGRGLWIHNGPGVGAPLIQGAVVPRLPCSCGTKSHPLGADDILDMVKSGKRTARVEGQRGLSPVD